MTNPVETAVAYFTRGYNCAQATAAAFAPELGFDEAQLLQLAAGLGGGMGGLRDTCGAVSAMALVASMKLGRYQPEDTAAKRTLYALVRKMHAEFVERHGTANCRELLQRAAVEVRSDPSERDPTYYARRPCARFVATAAAILERELKVDPPTPDGGNPR